MDAFFTRLERGRRVVEHKDGSTSEKLRYAANTRRIHRAVIAGVLQQAVLHKAIPSNPVRELERIESPKGHRTAPPRGLTAEQRRRLLAVVDADKGDPDKPARALIQLQRRVNSTDNNWARPLTLSVRSTMRVLATVKRE